MKPNRNISDREMQHLLDVAQAGIDRFFSEGYARWSKDNFIKLFNEGVNIEDPRIQSTLKKWEKSGIIKKIGLDDCYIEILQPFP